MRSELGVGAGDAPEDPPPGSTGVAMTGQGPAVAGESVGAAGPAGVPVVEPPAVPVSPPVVPPSPPVVPPSPPVVPPSGPPRRPRDRRGDGAPRLFKILLIVGAVLMVISGVAMVGGKLLSNYLGDSVNQQPMLPPKLLPEGKTIDGAVNVILLGMDERKDSTSPIRTDSIIIVHIPASHEAVYLISLPRDTRVDIPAFPENNYPGGVGKLTEAFEIANTRDGRGDPSPAGRARGVALSAETINALVPGGLKLNAAAVVDFAGFRRLVEAMGGVDMCIDARTVSDHYDVNGIYVGDTFAKGIPGYVYEKGCRHLSAKEALDYVRQRKSLKDGDYGRQRHQQQFLYAVFSQLLNRGTLTNVSKFGELRAAARDLLTLDLGGVPIEDWIFTFKHLRANDIQLIKTNAGKFNGQRIGNVDYELLTEDTQGLLQALHDDRVADFLTHHPEFIAKAK